MLTIALNRYYLVYYSRSKASTFLRPPPAASAGFGSSGYGRCSIPAGPISISIPTSDPLHSRLRSPSTIQTLARGLRSRSWIPSKLWSLPAAIWVFAILHSAPFANNLIVFVPSHDTNFSYSTSRRCVPADTPFNELTLTLFVFVTQYLFPLGEFPNISFNFQYFP